MRRLDQFDNSAFDRGRPAWVEAVWLVVQGLFLNSWLPGSAWRRTLLRMFGADIGKGVIIKPHVRVKFPWRLSVGDHSWIGESVWIDNLAQVTIGAHCCISQGAYLCTGNHDWSSESFDLMTSPITVGDGAWIAAKAVIAPGTVVETGAVVPLGTVARGRVTAGKSSAPRKSA